MATYSDPTQPISMDKEGKASLASVFVLLAGILAVLLALFLYWQTVSSLAEDKSVQKEIAVNQQKLAALQTTANELSSYDKLAKQLHTLFDNQKDWDVVLGRIQTRLYKRMAVTSLQATDQGVFTFAGITTDYSEYAKIYASLTDAEAGKYFTKVKPVSVAKVETKDGNSTKTSINFAFSMSLQPSVMDTKTTQN